MSRKTPLLSPRIAASTRAVESGSVSVNSPEDCMSVEPVRFHDIVRTDERTTPCKSSWLFRASCEAGRRCPRAFASAAASGAPPALLHCRPQYLTLMVGYLPPQRVPRRVVSRDANMSELSTYELQRQRNIEANNVVLQGLGLLDSIVPRPSKQPVAARITKRRLDLDRPKREQPKRDARPQYTLAEAQAALAGAEREERGAKKRRKKWRQEAGGDEQHSGGSRGGYLHTQVVEAEAKWSLPPLPGGGEHRKSCHICTQGVASWRGDFSRPLGCSTCPLIWCSRCLTNIYSEFQEEGGGMAVHAFIAQANLLLLTTHHLPLTTYYSRITNHCLLLTTYRFFCAGQRRRSLHLSHVPGGVRVPAPQGG